MYSGDPRTAEPQPPPDDHRSEGPTKHPQLLDLSRGPVFGFISPGRRMHLWLPALRLVLLFGDITAPYEDLAAGRQKSVSLQVKKVSFSEYFRDGKSSDDDRPPWPNDGPFSSSSAEPTLVETMMVKVAIVSLLVSLSVTVIGALVFGGRCGGRKSSDSEGSEDAADPVGRHRKRRKGAKSLEVKSAYWGPLRVRILIQVFSLLMICLHRFSSLIF